MSKTLSPALEAHYAGDTLTLAKLWKITRRDGEVFGFTDHDKSLTFSGVDYEATSVFDASAINTRSEFNVDNLSLIGLLDSGGITADDIESGLWDGATVEVREVNWADLTDGANLLMSGDIGQIQRKRGQYTGEMRGLMQKLQNVVGRVVNSACDADLGDARCGVDLGALTVSGTVTSVASRRLFTASGLAQAEAYFSGGRVTFTSGANDGISMEIKTHATGGVITLHLPMPYGITAADTFDITPGCDKTFATCQAKFNNVVNFRGFPDVPGPDQVLKVGGQ